MDELYDKMLEKINHAFGSSGRDENGLAARLCAEVAIEHTKDKQAETKDSREFVELCLRHKKLRETKNILISIYTNASGYLWSIMKVDSGTDLGWSEFNGDCEMSGTFTTYEKALEDALNLIDKADLTVFQKKCPANKFHWGNYASWLSENYRK